MPDDFDALLGELEAGMKADAAAGEQQPDGFLSKFKTLDTFEEQEAEWLVDGLIPKGQITCLGSDGGVGKSSIWIDLIASISSGKESILDASGFTRDAQKVAFLSTEDSVRKMLKKRLRLAGADMKNIITPDFVSDKEGELRDLKFGSPKMATFIRYFKPALCVFDPLQGFLNPDLNMGARNAMRDALAELISLGEETGTAFLIICHSNKRKAASGRERLADSADIWDIARSVLMAGFTSKPGIRYLSHEKSNYGPLQQTILFSVDSEGRVQHEGFTSKRDRDFMAAAEQKTQAPKREGCERWILTALEEAGGAMETKILDDGAKGEFSQKTLRDAKEKLSKNKRIRTYQKNRVWYTELTNSALDWEDTLPAEPSV